MAEQPAKVVVQASRVDTSILPSVFSIPYQLYVIQQSTDLKNVADGANNAGELAYEATIKNEEQDLVLEDHDKRITALKDRVDEHDNRISTLETTVSEIDDRVSLAESAIESLQSDKASKEESLLKSGNLAGIADTSVARTNLGLGDSAVKNTGSIAGTVAAGDDARLSTVNNKSGGTISSAVIISGKVTATGMSCRAGASGSTSINAFNINWTSDGKAELWIDAVRIGTINITP